MGSSMFCGNKRNWGNQNSSLTQSDREHADSSAALADTGAQHPKGAGGIKALQTERTHTEKPICPQT